MLEETDQAVPFQCRASGVKLERLICVRLDEFGGVRQASRAALERALEGPEGQEQRREHRRSRRVRVDIAVDVQAPRRR